MLSFHGSRTWDTVFGNGTPKANEAIDADSMTEYDHDISLIDADVKRAIDHLSKFVPETDSLIEKIKDRVDPVTGAAELRLGCNDFFKLEHALDRRLSWGLKRHRGTRLDEDT